LDFNRLKHVMHAPSAVPLHERLHQAIHVQIMDGTLRPGDSLPSERVLQQELNISRAIAHQAITALAQTDLLRSVPGAGTFVLDAHTEHTDHDLIGLIVSTPNFHFFYPQLAAAFNAVIRRAGYRLTIAMHNEQAATLKTIVDGMLAQDVKALAITPPRFGDFSGTLDRLRERNIPLIFIGRPGPSQLIDSISTDNELIGWQATHHLIDLGHRRIVHLCLSGFSTGHDRAAGYVRAMTESGLEPAFLAFDTSESPALYTLHDEQITSSLTYSAYSAVRESIATGALDGVTGLFCFNDVSALGAYNALRDAARRIPEDVSLVSVDNLITVRPLEVPLTTFALPGQAIGRGGAELLLMRLAGDTMPPQTILLTAPLIVRGSSAPPSC